MPFGFGHHDEAASTPPANGVPATALVTATEEPLDNLNASHADNLAMTQVLIDAGTGPIVGYRGLPLDADHWITAGMSVPVIVNPADPNGYVIDWANVPSIQQRVASNESSLVDPMAARLRVWDALASAGFHEPDLDQLAPRLLPMEMASMRAQLAAEPDAFARQLAGVAGLTAPADCKRALVQIATTTATWGTRRRTETMHRQVLGSHKAVLSVSVPGSAPYAVLIENFDHEERQWDENNPGLPAIVSIDDPTSVRVMWEEMAQIGQPLPYAAAAASSSAAPPISPNAPTGDAKAVMTASAQAMLARMPPASRPAMIGYYKTMGIDLDPNV
jgi:hypothetical protein